MILLELRLEAACLAEAFIKIALKRFETNTINLALHTVLIFIFKNHFEKLCVCLYISAILPNLINPNNRKIMELCFGL